MGGGNVPTAVQPDDLRVLVVTVVHTPLDARIHHRQIAALRAAGARVTYVAPWRATGTDPADVHAGVQPVDVPRASGRARLRALRAARRTIAALGPDHDLVLLHDPELVLAVIGARRRLPPVVLDVHEDLVGSLPDRPWVPAPLRPVARRLAARLERWAEDHLHLLLAEHAYQQRFTRPHPVVANLPWVPADPPPAGSAARVVHVGRLSVGRGVHELLALGASMHTDPIHLDAADGATGPASAARDGAAGTHGGARVRLELVGPADADVEPLVQAAHDRGELIWHGFRPNAEALVLVAGSVAGLALLHDLPNYRSSRPTKVVEYLAAGVPAIVTPLPEAVALVERSGGGVVVPHGDLGAVRAAVAELAADRSRRARLGAAGRATVVATESWDAAAPAFVATLAAVAAGRSVTLS